MAGWGEKIADISVEELKERLVAEEDGKAVKRLFTAIEYRSGLSPAKIEEKYGIPEGNVYTWLDRFEERGLEDALYDVPKPGKESALTSEEWNQLRAALQKPPEAVGYTADTWTSTLVKDYIETEFDVDYHPRHVRRLMKKAGLSRPQTRSG